MERSGFKPWPGKLYCALGEDTLLSQGLSPPRCINGYEFNAMDQHPIQGGVEIFVVPSCYGHGNEVGTVDSYKELSPKQTYKLHEDEKQRKYASRIIEVENDTFTPLVFTTTGGMSQECQRCHSRLAELISSKKQEEYATTITWIRTKVSFAFLRTALVCLRATRSWRRKTNVQENDIEIEKGLAGLT